MKCPICGSGSLETRNGKFVFTPPPNIPGGNIVIDGAEWEECSSCGEQIFPPSLQNSLEEKRYERLGLLRPEDIRDIRKRAGLTQTEMADFVGVGEKTYTRWESGRSLQNKSSDTLIRLADMHPELFIQVEVQRDPSREIHIKEYLSSLQARKGINPVSMAAHGGNIDPALCEELRKRLNAILENRKGK